MIQLSRELNNGVYISVRKCEEPGYKWWSFEPEQEALLENLLSVLPDDGCFVNIGASIGFYPIWFKLSKPAMKVQAYEPLDRHREFFLENMHLNGIDLNDIDLYSEGVSCEHGHVDYFANGFGSTIISKREATTKQKLKQIRLKLRRWLMDSGIWNYQLEFMRIPIVSLHTVVERAGGSIDLLLTDVQGSEGDILQGGQEMLADGAVKTLVVNTHGASMHDTCRRLLEQHNYHILCSDRKEKGDGLLVASHPSSTEVIACWAAKYPMPQAA